MDDSWFKLCPTYGKDSNVNDIVKAKLASLGYGDVNVSIRSSDDEGCIAPDGSISYFYADPESERYLWFNSVPVVFTIEKGGATAEYSVNVTVKVLGDETKQDTESTITADREIKDGAISLRTKWFGKAKVQLSCPSPDGTRVLWTSSNDKIKIDSNGLVTLSGRDGESGYITAAVIDENNVVLSISRVKVNFEKPKFNLIEYLRDFFEHLIALIKNAF